MLCSICQNGYERFICRSCREDPANVDWCDGKEVANQSLIDRTHEKMEWGQAPDPSERQYLVSQLLAIRTLSYREIAERIGVSKTTVFNIAKKLGLRKSDS